ncbi:zinc finger protein ZFP2 [Musca vetustissima]|uniref:zinc finger protein ZFP2 n=1 Tax=Musca vetustissima TaxID=27455 RepID=UPI002AB74E8E|nr:zinc finger protein ZFP2 [Musca vetustissima]
MHELRMGYKQSLLQRLQQIEMSAYQKSETEPTNKRRDTQPADAEPAAAGAVGLNVTDFSIQRILGDSPDKCKPSQSPRTSSSSITQDTPPTSPKLYAPVATKAQYPVAADILDLSKTKTGTSTIPSSNPALEFPYTTPDAGFTYPAIHPNILAAMAAQKFYAQFLPQMFSGATTTAAMAGLYQQLPLPRSAPGPATSSYQKRYFAPYVLNNNNNQNSNKQNPTHTPLTPPTPTAPQCQTSAPSSSTSTPTTSKYICSRLDCSECLENYYKTPNSATGGYSYKSPILSPTASTISSTSSYHSKIQKDVMLSAAASTNISLTSVTNIHLTTGKGATGAGGSMSTLFESRNSEEISYKCRICDKVFGCSQTLQAHEKTHKSPRYECTDCGKGFSQLRNYKYHLSVHRGTKEFAAECPECGKTFNDKGYLSSHMKIHRNKKEYECPYCPKSFNQRVAFNMHVRIHTGVKPHKCAECGKRFSRKMLLKQHMRTHSGEKPYQCSVCGKSFADRSNMTLHHRLHSGIKPFNCPICPKAFTKKHHLKTHLNYHTGCKPYVCPHPNCNQAFTQSSNMRTHAKKCQYRPLQMTQFSTPSSAGAVASSAMANSSITSSSSSAETKSSISAASVAAAAASSSSAITAQSLLLNTISRLPSTAGVGSNGNSLYHGVNVPSTSISSIPYMPSTTLSAGIRMLSTVHNSVPTTASTGFPPAQQPLLSTLRPF